MRQLQSFFVICKIFPFFTHHTHSLLSPLLCTTGTDANVFIQIFGEHGDSGEQKLSGARNCFERGQRDEFGFECVDLGKIRKIRVGHDNSGFGASWFLDKVIVRAGSGKEYYFLCGHWLSKDEEDGTIVRELEASEMDGEASSPLITYRVTTVTGDRRGAGTSANVSTLGCQGRIFNFFYWCGCF